MTKCPVDITETGLTVKCDWAGRGITRLVPGKKYELLNTFWANGEGHCRVRDELGVFEAPDIFFQLWGENK